MPRCKAIKTRVSSSLSLLSLTHFNLVRARHRLDLLDRSSHELTLGSSESSFSLDISFPLTHHHHHPPNYHTLSRIHCTSSI